MNPEHQQKGSAEVLSDSWKLDRLIKLFLFQARMGYYRKAPSGKLVETSLISVAKDGGSNAGFSLPSAAVDFIPQENPASKRDV